MSFTGTAALTELGVMFSCQTEGSPWFVMSYIESAVSAPGETTPYFNLSLVACHVQCVIQQCSYLIFLDSNCTLAMND